MLRKALDIQRERIKQEDGENYMEEVHEFYLSPDSASVINHGG